MEHFKIDGNDEPYVLQVTTLTCKFKTFIMTDATEALFGREYLEENPLPQIQEYEEIVGENMVVNLIERDSKFVPIYVLISVLNGVATDDEQRQSLFNLFRERLLKRYPLSSTRIEANVPIATKFKQLDDLMKSPNIDYRTFLFHLLSLYKEGKIKGNEWISSYLFDLTQYEFDSAYQIFEKYGTFIDVYSIRLITTDLLLFINSTIKIHRSEKPSNQLVNITSHKICESNPLYAMSFKRLQKHISAKKTPLPEKLLKSKLDFVKSVDDIKNVKIEPFSDTTVRYPSRPSLEPDNAGRTFKDFYFRARIKAKYIIELASRDLTEQSGVFANIKIEQ